MHTLRRVDIKRREDLFESIKRFTHVLKDTLPVQKIYLFGSFAKDEIHEGSDIDLLIIGDFRESFFNRIGKILDLTDLPVEPLVYTEEEFENLKKSQNPLITEILKTAIQIA